MPKQNAESIEITCEQCGVVTVVLPIIVDLGDLENPPQRADLLARIQAETIHRVACAGCGSTLEADTPLLLHVPGQEPPLVFSPAQATTAERERQAISTLVARWRKLRSEASSGKAVAVTVVPRKLLPAVLTEGLQAVRQRFTSAQVDDLDPISALVQRFAQARSWIDAYRIAREHPELVSEPAEAVLVTQSDRARAVNDKAALRAFEEFIALLRRCRELGIAAAFAEKLGCTRDELDQLDRDPMPGVPDAIRDSRAEANSAEQRYRRTGDPSALDMAVACWQRVLSHPDLAATTQRVRLAIWNSAATSFVQRYQERGTLGDLDRALALWTLALDEIPLGSSARAIHLNNLGNGLHSRYERAGRMEDLQKAIDVWRQATTSISPDSSNRPIFLTNLGHGLHTRYKQAGRLLDLEEAISVYQEAVATSSPDSPDRPAFLNNLGNGLATRHARTGQMEDLQDAINAYQEAVAITSPSSPDRPTRLKNLGSSLSTRYKQTEQMEDLQSAIDICRQAVATTGPESPRRPAFLNSLAAGLLTRHERTGQMEDLQEAIHAFREAAAAISPDSPQRPVFLNNLGSSLYTSYERTEQMQELQEAIDVCHQAVAVSPAGSPDQPGRLTNLAEGLRTRHERTRRTEDLQEAIDILRQAVAAAPTDSQERPTFLGNLGIWLHTRYQRTRRMEDLREAIDIHRQTVAAARPSSSDRLSILMRLGIGLILRYEITGQMEDLQEAIAVYRQAVAASPPDSAPPALLSDLGNSLNMRHDRMGRMEDLWEAIDLYRRGVAASSPHAPHWPGLLNNLGGSLRTRYQRTGQMEDLQEAIAVGRQAVATISSDSPDRPGILSSLAGGLITRYEQTGQMEDLQEAIDTARQAVAATSPDSSYRPRHLSNLGTGLYRRYARTRRMEDLQDAIDTWREAVAATSLDSLDRPMCLNHLGNGLKSRYGLTGQTKDLHEGIDAYRQAVESGRRLAPEIAVGAALNWADWALQRGADQEASGALDQAMDVVDMLYEEQLLRSGKQSWLRAAQTLYALAAYCRARLGDPTGAVLALETGRARALIEALDRNRADLEHLATQAPEVYARYRAALARLSGLEAVVASQTPHQQPGIPEQIRQVRGDLHAAVGAIRGIVGYESFLAPLRLEALQRELVTGVPVIYVAATHLGGLALIVSQTPDGMAVTPLWLKALTDGAVRAMLFGASSARTADPGLDGWLGAYLAWRRQPGNAQATAHWHELVTRTTRSLWNLVVGPVVERLRASECCNQSSPAQAILIPGGLLALLPLHAAWTNEPDTAQAVETRWALDEVAFHYAPSLRTLAHARVVADDYEGQLGPMRLLAVDDPRPTLAPRLPNSEHEVDAAAVQFDRNHVIRLAHERCRRVEILEAMTRADVCHFSCHGANHWGNPLQSGLLMAGDEMLTVEDLLALPTQRNRLAVLSACETGIVGTDVPDEVVALPAAFVQAGFAGVVASLWSVYDVSVTAQAG